MKKVLRLNASDNVGVALENLIKGDVIDCGSSTINILEDIPSGHKVAIEGIKTGNNVIKYGVAIGHALTDIFRGAWVHTHNVKTNLNGKIDYKYAPVKRDVNSIDYITPEINVFQRKNGMIGIRNEIWIVPTVGCVNGIAAEIVNEFNSHANHDDVDGIYYFNHPYGCSQLGADHERTRAVLQNIAVHPNAGGVLVLGLGCENNQIKTFKETMPEGWDQERIKFIEAQSVEDEIEVAVEILEELYRKVSKDVRTPGRFSDLVIGLECGGSDAFSGITANPLLGLLSDYVVLNGGSSMLTEVPEMFGAEHILMEQCDSKITFNQTVVKMINGFKDYYKTHDQPIYKNPSPGNLAGGITTLEEKSLGCTKKAGNSSVVDVLKIDQRIKKKGVNLLSAPGNDSVATTALGSAGCHLVLFTTGRGNPFGGFIPTIKIATNSALAEKKPHWIDFDAGQIIEKNVSWEDILKLLIEKVVSIINGYPTHSEKRSFHEIAIFKTGVTL
jgi:altronate hydrolase